MVKCRITVVKREDKDEEPVVPVKKSAVAEVPKPLPPQQIPVKPLPPIPKPVVQPVPKPLPKPEPVPINGLAQLEESDESSDESSDVEYVEQQKPPKTVVVKTSERQGYFQDGNSIWYLSGLGAIFALLNGSRAKNNR